MPCYDFQCEKCKKIHENIVVDAKYINDVIIPCGECKIAMIRLFPTTVHTNIDHIVDGEDRGKVVSEKNIKLKKMHAGYEREEQNLRKSITKQVEEKIAKEKRL